MATPLKHWRKQAKLRWLLPAICLALPCASSVQGQAVTRALPGPQAETILVPNPIVVNPDTVVVVEKIVGFYPVGDRISVDETDTLVVALALPDSAGTPTPFVVVIREKPPPNGQILHCRSIMSRNHLPGAKARPIIAGLR